MRIETCLAGFTLYGWRHSNGMLQPGDSKVRMESWPSELTLLGRTFTLEDVVQPNPPGTHGDRIFENAEYA
jgi:hypothetical protein